MPYVRIWVHLIWSTKNRDKVITEKIQPLLINHLIENAKQKEIYLDMVNCMADHCHLLLSLSTTQNIGKIVQLLKGESSHWINKNNFFHGHFEWQEEYFAISVSESQVNQVRQYINKQKDHHHKRTFTEEYSLLIKNVGFEI
ncbi:MAG TPA: IS200/IS605 family transposase [bacterium]|nr:IS200/IS605 family transposase [bacterium]HPN44016.1 IS200/IS605 family transposase [bacterium]